MVGSSGCAHEDAYPDEWDWHPRAHPEIEQSPVRRAPHCLRCGHVRNTSSLRAKRLGFFVNALARLNRRLWRLRKRKGLPLMTRAQLRLIVVNLLRDRDFEDQYWMDRDSQVARFFAVVSAVRPDIPREWIEEAMEFEGED